MNAKLKYLKLKNYCGYKNFEMDLSDGEGVLRWAMLFGPNGIGKSNLLQAINLLGSPKSLKGRTGLSQRENLFFRKMTYHPDYNPTYVGFQQSEIPLYMEAVFSTDDGDKKIIVENDWDEKSGIVLNELDINVSYLCGFADADKLNSVASFQIPEDQAEKFLDIAEAVYGFTCELPTSSMVEDQGRSFYTDFVLYKFGKETSFIKENICTKVHYKSFSAGEKKIATLICNLFSESSRSNGVDVKKILLIDNIEMHIYWKRHIKLLKMIDKYFPEVQIIATTHSPVIIKGLRSKYLFDLETIFSKGKREIAWVDKCKDVFLKKM